MKWLMRSMILALALAGWFVMDSIHPDVASASPSTESCFVGKINAERSSRGIGTLAVDSRLVTIARRHSQRMANDGTIYHNSNLPNEAPPEWEALGENVGMGPDCASLHQAFMNSASHRKNILNSSFNFIGVGVVIKDGTIYVTQVFMKASSSSSSPPPPPPPPPEETTSSSGSSSTTSSPRRTTAAPQPSPSPSPSPLPPGSKVTGFTQHYFDLLEGEPKPSEDELAEHRKALRDQALEELRAEQQARQREKEEQGLFGRIAAFIAAVLS